MALGSSPSKEGMITLDWPSTTSLVRLGVSVRTKLGFPDGWILVDRGGPRSRTEMDCKMETGRQSNSRRHGGRGRSKRVEQRGARGSSSSSSNQIILRLDCKGRTATQQSRRSAEQRSGGHQLHQIQTQWVARSCNTSTECHCCRSLSRHWSRSVFV